MNNNGIEQGKYDPEPRPLRMGKSFKMMAIPHRFSSLGDPTSSLVYPITRLSNLER
jgi:hypothetical protein